MSLDNIRVNYIDKFILKVLDYDAEILSLINDRTNQDALDTWYQCTDTDTIDTDDDHEFPTAITAAVASAIATPIVIGGGIGLAVGGTAFAVGTGLQSLIGGVTAYTTAKAYL